MNQLDLRLEKIKSGDRNTYRTLVEENMRSVYTFSFRLTGNHDDADDLAQIVFIKFFKSVHLYRQESNLRNWLFKIAINSFIDKKRKKVDQIMFRFKSDDDKDGIVKQEFPSKRTLPDKETESSFIRKHISNALQKLSPKEKTAFVLRHYQGHSLKEIALSINTSEGTVKSLLFRGAKKMQQALAFYKAELGLEENS